MEMIWLVRARWALQREQEIVLVEGVVLGERYGVCDSCRFW